MTNAPPLVVECVKVIARPIYTYSITLPLSDGLSGQQKPPDRLYSAGFCATQHSGHYSLPVSCWPAWASGIILEVHGWPGRLNAALR